MNLEKHLMVNEMQIKNQKMYGNVSLALKNIKFEDITKEIVFELLKIYVGSDNKYYDLLSIDDLTFVKPGIRGSNGQIHTMRYVYEWSGSLIQIYFNDNPDNDFIYVTIKMLN